jgi:hypothetical protein
MGIGYSCYAILNFSIVYVHHHPSNFYSFDEKLSLL